MVRENPPRDRAKRRMISLSMYLLPVKYLFFVTDFTESFQIRIEKHEFCITELPGAVYGVNDTMVVQVPEGPPVRIGNRMHEKMKHRTKLARSRRGQGSVRDQ